MSYKFKIAVLGLFLLFVANPAHAGAWGHKSFENDDALDWVENYFKPGGQRLIESTIASINQSDGYLQAPECCYAIAACEVLAAARGKPAADAPKDLVELARKLPRSWVESQLAAANAAMERILANSELRELWEEANFEAWKKVMADLKIRLS